MGPTSTLVDSQQNFKRIHPSCRYIHTYNSHFSFRTRGSPRGGAWGGSGAPPTSARSSWWSASVRGHMSPGLTRCVPCEGLSLTLDTGPGSAPHSSPASGVRGQARPGLPCNRAPARGPSPQLIKVKTKKHEHCQRIQKGTQPRKREICPAPRWNLHTNIFLFV